MAGKQETVAIQRENEKGKRDGILPTDRPT
jgi:hypothetical protein